jgi:hypothetical protein
MRDSCPPPHTVGNGVEHLLSHVQAILASKSSEEAATTSGSLPGIVAETALSILTKFICPGSRKSAGRITGAVGPSVCPTR